MQLIAGTQSVGLGAVVVTHDAHLASWSDRVINLHDGHLVDEDAPDTAAQLVAPAATLVNGPGRESMSTSQLAPHVESRPPEGGAPARQAPLSAGHGASFAESGVSSSSSLP